MIYECIVHNLSTLVRMSCPKSRTKALDCFEQLALKRSALVSASIILYYFLPEHICMDISLMYIYIHILLIYINYLRYIYIFKYIHTYTCIYIYSYVCVPWLQKMSPLRRFRPKAIQKSSTLSTWPSSHRLLQSWIL